MKAIEAAALAWAEHERNGFCMSADGKRRLTIAIRAYLNALSEDDAAVERIARAICEAQGLDWKDQFSIRSSNGDPEAHEAFKHDARAAIRAMGGE